MPAQAVDGSQHWQDASRLITEQALFAPIYTSERIYFVSDGIADVGTSEANGGAVNPTYWVAAHDRESQGR